MNNLLNPVDWHEQQLRQYFQQFDLPPGTNPINEPLNILIFVNRSGSSLIAEYLRATGQFSGFGEPLNHEQVIEQSEKFGITTFAGYLRWLIEYTQQPGTQFGIKASHGQVLMLLRSGAIPRYFNNVRWIFVQRMDVLSQAVSFCIADQTKQWDSSQAKSGKAPAYDFETIRDRVLSISDAYSASLALMGLRGITPYHLTYEQFLLDPQQETRKLSSFLGVDHVVVDTDKLRMEKQADAINDAFRTRFIGDFQSWLAAQI